MNRMIFVNLPVEDLRTAGAFYEALGFSPNPQFSDHTATCVVVSESIFVMLLTRPRFAEFTTGGPIADAGTTEVINCLSAGSRAEVDDLYRRAVAAGGKPWRAPIDEAPMYGVSFADPDGHVWEVLHMDLPAGDEVAPA